MNDLVDDIHSDIEYPIEHYARDQASDNGRIESRKMKIQITYGEKCVDKISFNRREWSIFKPQSYDDLLA